MAALSQIQVRYHPVEDRLLLRMSTSDHQEFQFWLTRRCVQGMWPLLVKLLKEAPSVTTRTAPQHREEVLAFQHQQAVSQADFQTGYREEEERTRPLGEAPMLVKRVDVRRDDQGTAKLGLRPAEGQGVELGLGEPLLHSLSKLIADSAERCGWGLGLRLGAAGTEEDASRRAMN